VRRPRKPAKLRRRLNMNFATKMKELRTQQGIRLEQLASATGVSINTLRGYERGARVPGVDSARRIANVLGVGLLECLSGPLTAPADAGPLTPAGALGPLKLGRAATATAGGLTVGKKTTRKKKGE
jgi:transcriptional regulator with XRE-family HTH domain